MNSKPPPGDESRFRDLADNISDVFYTRDASSAAMLYASAAYEKVWGASLASLREAPLGYLDAVHPDDRAALARAHEDNLRGRVSDIEYRLRQPGGGLRWLRDVSYPVMEKDGAVSRIVGSARDITDRKNEDVQLARTHRALKLLSQCHKAISRAQTEQNLLDDICRLAVDVGGSCLAWAVCAGVNEDGAISAMASGGQELGYLAVLEMSWRDDHHPSGRGPAGRAMRSGQAQQVPDIAELGDHFLWRGEALKRGLRSAIFLPLRTPAGVLGLVAMYWSEPHIIGRDEVDLLQELADSAALGIEAMRARQANTKSRDEARRALEKVREQASLLDKASDAIVVRDLQHRVLYWNQGAERLFLWTAAEAVGRSVLALMAEQEGFDRAMRELLAHGEWRGELDARARDGSARIVEGHWTLVRDEAGRPQSVLAINTDIRERKRAREEILQLNASLEDRVRRRTAELEYANQQLEAFSYSVSHDLRSPLTAMDGFSRMLEKALEKEMAHAPASRSYHYVSRIRAGIRQMGELIEAMLSLAHVSRDGLRREQVDLSAIATEVLEGYRQREPERPCRFDVEPGLVVPGDSRLLRQVLDNLLGNAWKFSSKAPVTHISLTRQPAAGSRTGEDAGSEPVFAVTDRGAGFEMAQANMIFDVFQRLHSPAEFPGSGVGLATVQRIVARHGGRVWAEAVPGQGATFYFTLGPEPAPQDTQ